VNGTQEFNSLLALLLSPTLSSTTNVEERELRAQC